MNNQVWIVVANGSRARIFKNQTAKVLIELEAFEHPQTRLHGRDLISDKPGREFASAGNRRSAIEPSIDPQKNEAHHFALELAQYLDHACRSQQFKKLYLIAGPAFLGLLRDSLHKNTVKTITDCIDKDLSEKTPTEIRDYLPLAL